MWVTQSVIHISTLRGFPKGETHNLWINIGKVFLNYQVETNCKKRGSINQCHQGELYQILDI
jgi:hypothetical protein